MSELVSDLHHLLLLYMLPAARALGVLAFLPGLSAAYIPPQVRLVIGGAVALLAGGAAGPRLPPANEADLLIALLGELGLGLIVGWAVAVFFESLRWAGEIVDMQLGLRAGQFFDPIAAHGSSLLGQVYYLTAITFFFVIDGHHWILAALGRSFERLPPGELGFGAPALELLVSAAASALDIGVRMAAAGMASLLLADVALAIVGRHVPQMNVFLVGIPAKIGAGLLVLAVTAPAMAGVMGVLLSEVKGYLAALLTGG